MAARPARAAQPVRRFPRLLPRLAVETALQAHDRGVIPDAALRRETGFAEDDAPTAEELAAWEKQEADQAPPQDQPQE
ncbi:hypothetical protein [Streptomyces misionensis]|uniref:hypothetical protein n=1 Tax=Streptomyces misionensis TaxID=67331 RepID=UPI00368D4423